MSQNTISTLQTSGGLMSSLLNRTTNNLVCTPENNNIAYFPKDHPGPDWTYSDQLSRPETRQWRNYSYPDGTSPFPTSGTRPNILIGDCSPQSVPLGKTYALYTEIVWMGVRFYFELTGVDGGTTCLPGFGLFNLSKNPGAWTYLTPQVFEGVWQISLSSAYFMPPLVLSVDYLPYQEGLRSGLENFPVSRLNFSVSGAEPLSAGGHEPEEDVANEARPQQILLSTSAAHDERVMA